MKKEIEILEMKINVLEKINILLKGKFNKEIIKIKKDIEELKKADNEIWGNDNDN